MYNTYTPTHRVPDRSLADVSSLRAWVSRRPGLGYQEPALKSHVGIDMYIILLYIYILIHQFIEKDLWQILVWYRFDIGHINPVYSEKNHGKLKPETVLTIMGMIEVSWYHTRCTCFTLEISYLGCLIYNVLNNNNKQQVDVRFWHAKVIGIPSLDLEDPVFCCWSLEFTCFNFN